MPDPDNIPYYRAIQEASTPEEFEDLPIAGDAWRATNQIIEFYEFGCWPHWSVWVRTLWKPFGILIWELLTFGVGDIVRGYFRPSGLRGPTGLTRRGRRNGPRRGSARRGKLPRFQIPETGNAIGKALPGSQMVRSRYVGPTERILWKSDLVLQRVLWYWLVADVTSDFVVNWTSAIMASEACDHKREYQVYIDNQLSGALSGDEWQGTSWVQPEINEPDANWLGNSFQTFGKPFHCMVTAEPIAEEGWPLPSISIQIGSAVSPDAPIALADDNPDPGDPDSRSLMWNGQLGFQRVGVWVKSNLDVFFRVRITIAVEYDE